MRGLMPSRKDVARGAMSVILSVSIEEPANDRAQRPEGLATSREVRRPKLLAALITI
jgi:hypothetical protein